MPHRRERPTAAYFRGTKIEACTFLTVNTTQVALLRGPVLSLVKTSVKSECVESLRSIGILRVPEVTRSGIKREMK